MRLSCMVMHMQVQLRTTPTTTNHYYTHQHHEAHAHHQPRPPARCGRGSAGLQAGPARRSPAPALCRACGRGKQQLATSDRASATALTRGWAVLRCLCGDRARHGWATRWTRQPALSAPIEISLARSAATRRPSWRRLRRETRPPPPPRRSRTCWSARSSETNVPGNGKVRSQPSPTG